MLRGLGTLLAGAVILLGSSRATAQAAGPSGVSSAGSSAGTDRVAGQPEAAAVRSDTRTAKQKALALETERLFDMATQLKAEVNKTNKNILSLKVVEKAQEIEAMAKEIRTQAKK